MSSNQRKNDENNPPRQAPGSSRPTAASTSSNEALGLFERNLNIPRDQVAGRSTIADAAAQQPSAIKEKQVDTEKISTKKASMDSAATDATQRISMLEGHPPYEDPIHGEYPLHFEGIPGFKGYFKPDQPLCTRMKKLSDDFHEYAKAKGILANVWLCSAESRMGGSSNSQRTLLFFKLSIQPNELDRSAEILEMLRRFIPEDFPVDDEFAELQVRPPIIRCVVNTGVLLADSS